jgi:glycosyltransferase involved in cell wall biosynthesis
VPGRANPSAPSGAVAVVIPAYQAAATLPAVVAGVRRTVPEASVYVVDDGSTDVTGPSARDSGAIVLVHRRRCGKGAALETGIARALSDGAHLLVTLDADGQHPPADIPHLLAALVDGDSDLVLGARSRGGTMPLPRRCSNWLSAALASRIGGVRVADAQTGFRAMTRAVAQAIQPAERGYDYETAFLLAALARGLRVRSVGVPTLYGGPRSYFRSWIDTWRQARVFTRYARLIIFGGR